MCTGSALFPASLGRLLITALAALPATVPLYLLAVVACARTCLASASMDEKLWGREGVWMVLLFPFMAEPPLLPWLAVALPIALAAAVPHVPGRLLLAAVAFLLLDPVRRHVTAGAAATRFLRPYPSPIGDLPLCRVRR